MGTTCRAVARGEPFAVALLNLGGPETLDAVEPFLFNLFSDPDIISVPLAALTQKPLARYISRKRGPTSRQRPSRRRSRRPSGQSIAINPSCASRRWKR